MSMDRGTRRDRTKRITRRRVTNASAALIFGLDKKTKAQPHRVHKHKPKFTGNHSSMKERKQKANRAARHRAKQAIKAEKELPVESPNSVRWDVW